MLKYLAVIVVIFGLAIYVASQDEHAAQESTQNAANSHGGTAPAKPDENHPKENVPTTKRDSPSWFRFFRWPDGTTTLVIILTLIVIADQTKQTAIAAEATQQSVVEGKDTAKRQLRAYLIVNIGGAIYQEREKGLKFEGKPLLVNTGQTPARKVRYKAKSAILPFPPSDNFVFEEVGEDIGFGMLGAQQTATMGAIVDEFCEDEGVESIKKMMGKSLYIWGTVTYEDTFGNPHFTKFGQQLYWNKDNSVNGHFIPNHNDGD